jgi:hypothetical protein
MSVTQQSEKLQKLGLAKAYADALAAAGYGTPKLMRAALDATLEAIEDVGAAGLAALRARWPVS